LKKDGYMATTPFEIARIAAKAASGKKATDVMLLDLRGLSDVCDYFLICTAANARMHSSVVDEIEEKVKKNTGIGPLSHEGRAGASWVLLDYASVVVHAFLPETRDYYRLERLWGDAPHIELETEEEE
jgi:ribosome-associated protein